MLLWAPLFELQVPISWPSRFVNHSIQSPTTVLRIHICSYSSYSLTSFSVAFLFAFCLLIFFYSFSAASSFSPTCASFTLSRITFCNSLLCILSAYFSSRPFSSFFTIIYLSHPAISTVIQYRKNIAHNNNSFVLVITDDMVFIRGKLMHLECPHLL
jgi:hypothetical protein